MTGPVAPATPDAGGAFTSLDGEEFYRISAYDRMAPFLMTIPSDSDLWMFISSSGGLTAGRVDPDGSLFPYETVDRLHDAHHHTGPITLLRVRRDGTRDVLWQPFAERVDGLVPVERNLYKNTVGNRLVFEEIHPGLGLAFRQRWAASDELGWVRTVTLANLGSAPLAVSVLDGLRNVLPHGAPLALYQQSSSLVDAYKRSELDRETGLAIFSLTSKILDRPEAAEELRANVVWSHGLPNARACLSLAAIDTFRRGAPAPDDRVVTGQRGHYLASSSLTLAAGAVVRWHVVLDSGLGHLALSALRARLHAGGDLDREIEESLGRARENLVRIVASADGLQLTAHAEMVAHHFANVLFNNMRGGVFTSNHDVPTADFRAFLETRNRGVARRHAGFLRALPAAIAAWDLVARAASSGDADLHRLGLEYLPLYFGRRHGDPSRPWNRFRIQVRNDDGSRALRYEGNWRDIFQNWEALGASFPGFLPGIIARFLNASTMDGFNPYRITRDGIDWETIDPHHPWSGIGYWGDHQVIYLLRLLEALERTAPGALGELLDRPIFTYADVPYRLQPYEALVENPRETIVFDPTLAAAVAARVENIGTDGKLVTVAGGAIAHVSLLEKLLVPALSKLSNLVPDGGIWMNTQRPEWNDANNALVGNGLSVVTVCHLRRYLRFLERLLEGRADAPAAISSQVARWFRRVRDVLDEHRHLLDAPVLADSDRRHVLDALGRAFSVYREVVCRDGLEGSTDLAPAEIVTFCRTAVAYLDHAIRANHRPDGLYHSYNLLAMAPDGDAAAVHPLYVMLEGQVAALGSGLVGPAEGARLLDTLFDSALYCADRRSFLLYPDLALPDFMEKNVIAEARVRSVSLLAALAGAGEASIVARDAQGTYRFPADFTNARDLSLALDRLARQDTWREAVARDRAAVLEVFEEVFRHRSFTGRSGTMYGYEGLGCIYWHMVAKLLLAVQELALRAQRDGEPAAIREALVRGYERIRDGLGFARTPAEYGAFPTDPYSHTPARGGAQQPGMTGQVKEEILVRFNELGVEVADGLVRFRPTLLRRGEFLRQGATFRYYDVAGSAKSIDLPAGTLAFTCCQVPVIYRTEPGGPSICVITSSGAKSTLADDRLGAEDSRALLARRGTIARIDVGLRADALRP